MIALLGRAILAVGSCFSRLWIFPASPFWPAEFLLRNWLTVLWELPCRQLPSFAAFKILSLTLTFGILIMMCLDVGLFASILLGLCVLSVLAYLLHQIRDIFFHYFFKKVSNFLLFLFSSWHPYDVNVGTLEVVPGSANTILAFWILFSSCSDWLFFASLCSISLI